MPEMPEMPEMPPPFHLAFPVNELVSTRRFYGECLGCIEGRSSESWVDFDFFGHQITAHMTPASTVEVPTNPVDGDRVPIPHFGAVLPWAEWQQLAERLQSHGIAFLIGPRIRFEGEAGEQGTFFVRDPSGNHLEFKSFKDMQRMFAGQE
ncbi:MAG: extradiol dioxygenase family protein [Chlamydiales bacterium]|jgi:extradiol dioxygenase family protein